MPFNAIPGAALAKIEYTFRGQQCFNDLWFIKATGAVTVFDASNLANGIQLTWGQNVVPLLSNDLTLVRTTVRDYTLENGVEAVSTMGTFDGGAGDALPNNVAACVSLRTGFAGRHYRGRIYLPGIPRTAVTENEYLDDFMNGQLTALAMFIGPDAVANGWQLVVVARQQTITPGSAPVPIPGGIVTLAVAWQFTNNVVDSQRRRLPGRGK